MAAIILVALINIVSILPAILWPLMTVFIGDETHLLFNSMDMAFLWTMMVLSWGLVRAFLKKKRKLHHLLGIVTGLGVIASVTYILLFSKHVPANYEVAVTIVFVISMALGLFFMVWWKFACFREDRIVKFGQVMILLALLNLLCEETLVTVKSLFIPLILLAAFDFIINMTRNNRENAHIILGGGALILGGAAGVSYLMSGPIVVVINYLGIVAKKIGLILATGLAKVIGVLFGRGIRSADFGSEMNSTHENEEFLDFESGSRESFNVFKYVFYAACIAVLLWSLFTIIRAIVRKIRSISLGGITVEEAGVKDSGIKGLVLKIKALFKRIRAGIILRSHPDSIGAVLYRLEKKCIHNQELSRKKEDTPREFLKRIADSLDEDREKTAIMDFADEVDFVCYGREKDWLKKTSCGRMIQMK